MIQIGNLNIDSFIFYAHFGNLKFDTCITRGIHSNSYFTINLFCTVDKFVTHSI
ncbi:hypothetical protein BH10BAC3_BH10BAC3_26760 [soil metagenome]